MHVILKANLFLAGKRYRPDQGGGTIYMEDRLRPFLPTSAEVYDKPTAVAAAGKKPIDSQEKHFRKVGKDYDPVSELEALKSSQEDPMAVALAKEAAKAEADAAVEAEADRVTAEAEAAAAKLKSLEDKPVKAGKKN